MLSGVCMTNPQAMKITAHREKKLNKNLQCFVMAWFVMTVVLTISCSLRLREIRHLALRNVSFREKKNPSAMSIIEIFLGTLEHGPTMIHCLKKHLDKI